MIARAEVKPYFTFGAARAFLMPRMLSILYTPLRLGLHYDRDVVVENATRDTPLTTGYGNYRIF